MITNILRMRIERGQTLVEFILCFGLILVTLFLSIEVIRLLAFQSFFERSAYVAVKRIVLKELSLFSQEKLNDAYVRKTVEKVLKNKISKEGFFFSTLTRKIKPQFHIYSHVLNHVAGSRYPGIYLKINLCLPTLFQDLLGSRKKFQYRDCLGMFQNHSQSLSMIRVRTAVFVPLPASHEIFYHGLPTVSFTQDRITHQSEMNSFLERSIEILDEND